MSTQKAKFELFTRLQRLGFTYEESAALRRIEMTLRRWGEAECNGEIQRDDETGKPRGYYTGPFPGNDRPSWPIADREAGALRRCKAIVDARNRREYGEGSRLADLAPDFVTFYHQGDPRGCSLYLITREQLGNAAIDSVYNRGLAVCA